MTALPSERAAQVVDAVLRSADRLVWLDPDARDEMVRDIVDALGDNALLVTL